MSDVVLDKEHPYRGVCCVCLAPCGPVKDGERPFQTFSFGTEADNAYVWGIIPLCPAHREEQNTSIALLARLIEFRDGQWPTGVARSATQAPADPRQRETP